MSLQIFLIFLLNCYQIHAQERKINLNLPVIQTENYKLQRLDNQRYQLR